MIGRDNKTLTHTGIDKILQFLPVFKGKDFNIGQWNSKENCLSYFVFSDQVLDFEIVLYAEGFILDKFEWPNWKYGRRLMQNPELIQKANLLTLRKQMTTNIRYDRFCEGYLAGCFKDGTIVKILERLKELSGKLENMN